MIQIWYVMELQLLTFPIIHHLLLIYADCQHLSAIICTQMSVCKQVHDRGYRTILCTMNHIIQNKNNDKERNEKKKVLITTFQE